MLITSTVEELGREKQPMLVVAFLYQSIYAKEVGLLDIGFFATTAIVRRLLSRFALINGNNKNWDEDSRAELFSELPARRSRTTS